jgi:hypothetical protein
VQPERNGLLLFSRLPVGKFTQFVKIRGLGDAARIQTAYLASNYAVACLAACSPLTSIFFGSAFAAMGAVISNTPFR